MSGKAGRWHSRLICDSVRARSNVQLQKPGGVWVAHVTMKERLGQPLFGNLPSSHLNVTLGPKEVALIDQYTTLILTKKKGDLEWQDKTSEVDIFDEDSSHVFITYRNSPRQYTYSRQRAVVCTSGRVVPVALDQKVMIRGRLWSKSPSVVEFDAPDGTVRKAMWTNRDGSERSRLYRADEVQVIADAESSSATAAQLMQYFHSIADAKDESTDPIARVYKKLDFVHPESALAEYLSGKMHQKHSEGGQRVFPFNSNLSQQEAIDRALTHTSSIIEGPPGTGKTETILNLIANIVVGDLGSVAVVSLSNTATDNIEEKLREKGFGPIVARLGNRERQEAFFEGQETRNASVDEFLWNAPPAPDAAELAELDKQVRRLQVAERERSETRALLREYELEHEHFEIHRDPGTALDVGKLPLLRRPTSRLLDFIAETIAENESGYKPGLFARIRKRLRYGRMRDVDLGDAELVLSLQSVYYQRRIAELQTRLAELDLELESADFDGLLARRQQLSHEAFSAAVASRFKECSGELYDSTALWKSQKFRSLEREYPVVLSTCHSLLRNAPQGHLFDYLIIDESSQVDLLSATLVMSMCRNLVIVGDRKQLPQISSVPPGALDAPLPEYDYGEQSILSSAQLVYRDTIPTTLLREHYRCHPAIIGFCNRAFYDGELIPYTSADGRYEPAMRVQPTARGNHMRQHRAGGKSNQREIDVVLADVLPWAPEDIGPEDIALAAPYRQQVKKAQAQLSDQIDTVDTVHRLQGGAKKMVVMTTVLSETWQGIRGLRFVDDPRLINVAVSRAVDLFVLVTNFDRLPKSRYIRDLIGYIDYQYPNEVVTPSSVVSVFDLFYRDYDQRLAPLAARLGNSEAYQSEEIIRTLLEGILSESQYGHLRARSQVLLRNLVPSTTTLHAKLAEFVRRTSSVDFVLYNAITNRPVLVIEVDGFRWHEDRPKQLRRDAKKDEILQQIGLPLLRLRTTESNEEMRIRSKLGEIDV